MTTTSPQPSILDPLTAASLERLLALAAVLLARWGSLGQSLALDDQRAALEAIFETPEIARAIATFHAFVEGRAEIAAEDFDTFDYLAALGFLVWLLEAGGRCRLDPHFAELRAWFDLGRLARWGSPATRAAVGAWLADPWFPAERQSAA